MAEAGSLDPAALKWAAGVALAVTLSRLSQMRARREAGGGLTPWWVVLIESVVSTGLGAVLAVVVVPEIFPSWRGTGRQALLSFLGAALGPHLLGWIVQAAPQGIQALVKKHLGLEITVQAAKPAPEEVGRDERL